MAVTGSPKRVGEGVGPAGRRAAASLRQLRDGRRLTTAQLSALLSRLGRPILATGITKTEGGDRRIDVDDLIALAVALDTTPNRLLLPGSASDNESVELTPEVKVTALNAWKWATGEEPLSAGCAPPGRQMLISDDRERLFIRENQPHNLPEPYFRNVGHDMTDHPEIVQALAVITRDAQQRGISLGSLRRLTEEMYVYGRLGQLDNVIERTSNGGS